MYERLLAQHRRTRECQVCGELLDSFLSLKEHLMEHAGYNPCECQRCGRIFSTPEGRYRHEKAHDRHGSPFRLMNQKMTCPICGKTILRREHMKRHMLIHQDCPTYRCLLCGYSFKREDLIKGHVKKFHPKQVEASSIDLLFEKSFEDTAPERSQWNPHRKYRSTPRPVKVPGRGRGRPRKDPNSEPRKRPIDTSYERDMLVKTEDGDELSPRERKPAKAPVKKRKKEEPVLEQPKFEEVPQEKLSEDEDDDDDEDESGVSQETLDRVFGPKPLESKKPANPNAIWSEKKSVKVTFIGENSQIHHIYGI